MKMYIAISALVLALIFPLSSHAAKSISQEFTSGDIQAIFPLKGKPAYMLISNDFYSSNTPGSAFDWKKMQHSFARDNVDSYSIKTNVAITYDGYDYIAISTEEQNLDGPPLSFIPLATEVWRLSHDNPKKLEKVFGISGVKEDGSGNVSYNQFSDLFQFQNKLFLITILGDIFTTSNGTTWKEIQSIDIPEFIFLGRTCVGKNEMFILNNSNIYQSKDLQTWHIVKGKFDTDNVMAMDECVLVDDKIYLTTINYDGTHRLWRKGNNGKWKKLIKGPYLNLRISNINNHVYFFREISFGQWVIAKSIDGVKFKRLLKTSHQPLEGLTMAGKTIFAMYNGEEGTSYLLRVP